ncbi:MAG: hypothetical protein C0631_16765 [Sedimenticola sp.]|nr:MAG: hypothetical protein C0631_16765 [Sedimenticola sp.]
MYRYWPAIGFTLLCLLAGTAPAADRFSQAPHQSDNPNVEDYEWSEILVELPPFPVEGDLLEVNLDLPKARFRYLIDEKNLVSNKEDGTVQYTLVIQSPSGAKNIAFESIHCTQREFKSYAFGDSKGQWRRMRKPEWREIRNYGLNQYRYQLWNDYLCNNNSSTRYTTEDIIESIKLYRSDNAIKARR